MECLAKIFGTAGFYYTSRQVLRRLKVTSNSFENMFKEENYERNYEALVDFYWGVGLAMVKQFEQSIFFPDRENVDKYESENGYANILILARFKEWILDQSSRDKTYEFFLHLLPSTVCSSRYIKNLYVMEMVRLERLVG